MDTASEAVTNAVRHGQPGRIQVVVDLDPMRASGRVRITVTSHGVLTAGIGNGTGLARLMDRGADITLEQMDGRVMMRGLI